MWKYNDDLLWQGAYVERKLTLTFMGDAWGPFRTVPEWRRSWRTGRLPTTYERIIKPTPQRSNDLSNLWEMAGHGNPFFVRGTWPDGGRAQLMPSIVKKSKCLRSAIKIPKGLPHRITGLWNVITLWANRRFIVRPSHTQPEISIVHDAKIPRDYKKGIKIAIKRPRVRRSGCVHRTGI